LTKAELEAKHLAELHELAAGSGVPRYRMLRRDELVEELLVRGSDPQPAEEAERPPRRRRRRRPEPGRDPESASEAETDAEEPDPEPEDAVADEQGEPISGVLEVLPQGHGLLRLEGLDSTSEDVYVSASQIRRCELRPGDEVAGPARPARRGERHPALIRVEQVNGAEPAEDRKGSIDELTPVAPHRRLTLQIDSGDVLVRAADLLAPLAYGQRVLVRAEPRSGRTTLLRGLVSAIAAAPDPPGVVVLLVDERPEEITAWRRGASGVEIVAAAADLDAGDQIRHADLALARAKRRVEQGEDVVFVIDSLTRLGVASHDAAAVKRFFGAGRELEEEGSGSLTVVATALSGGEGDGVLEAVETTENATLTLDPALAAAGIVPALDPSRSSVTGEETLRDEAELAAARRLRAAIHNLDPSEAAALLRERIEGSTSNAELLAALR
jgi:transcription termination factor Rho